MNTKNLKIWQIVIFLLATTLFVTSCEKDDEPKKATKALEVKEKDITDYNKWYYFSFATGKFVGTGDTDPAKGDDAKWAKRTDWDIAFHRYDVRTNGGTSGKGQGAILKLATTKYDDVTEVGKGSFKKDEMIKDGIYLGDPHKQVKTTSSINTTASNWIGFSHEDMAWKMSKRNIFVVKTADGKYVKFQFINFLNEKDKSGYLSFKYFYQKDGSTKFE